MGASRNQRNKIGRFTKNVIGFLLLPLCFGVGAAVLRILSASGQAETIWVAFLAGAACWLVVYLTLPRPMWLYVFGHELTHAVFTWIMGGKVRRFKVTSRGGHVLVSKNNFLIALAPYFIPIYGLVVVLLFVVGEFLFGWRRYVVFFHLLLGAAYAFHLTLTWHVLKTHQSDIADQGHLFSAVIIWLGNASILVLGLPLLTGRISAFTALSWCFLETGSILQRLARFF